VLFRLVLFADLVYCDLNSNVNIKLLEYEVILVDLFWSTASMQFVIISLYGCSTTSLCPCKDVPDVLIDSLLSSLHEQCGVMVYTNYLVDVYLTRISLHKDGKTFYTSYFEGYLTS
jgi:hypothetical protein